MKRKIKLCVDLAMFLLFLYLLAYRPGMGLLLHAELGIGLFILFLFHHTLNLSWYRALLRGRYSFRRLLLTGTDFLLFTAMVCMMASSVMLSGMVFPFSGIRMTHGWRQLHVSSSAWCFLLMAFHVGMHLHGLLLKLQRKIAQTAFEYVYYLLLFLLFVLGIYCLIQSGMGMRVIMAGQQALLLTDGGLFFAEHLAMAVGTGILSHGILWGEERLRAKNRKNQNPYDDKMQ